MRNEKDDVGRKEGDKNSGRRRSDAKERIEFYNVFTVAVIYK